MERKRQNQQGWGEVMPFKDPPSVILASPAPVAPWFSYDPLSY